MDSAAFASLMSKGPEIFVRTRQLCINAASLKINSLQLVCELSELHGDIASGIRRRRLATGTRSSAQIQALFAMPQFNAARVAIRLVDEFGRAARVVAVERALACRKSGDRDGAVNWNDTFDAVMDIQHAERARARSDHRRQSGNDVSR